MKKLTELSFREIQQMQAYALGKVADFHRDAQEHVGKNNPESGRLLDLEKKWLKYAQRLDNELEARVEAALG
ncbi:hypothetical protein ACFQ4C_06880 [Larkinella insperata]|uniref:Uncharacterized protein n=1 Tax=Larkinella insperata TaxID=332158 RepID=A0ABW3Q577_9BACT